MKNSSISLPRLESETGRLESLLMHRPGPEVESVTPDLAKELLYNDVIPLRAVQDEYRQLRSFLSQVCQVYEVGDLLSDSLQSPVARKALIASILSVGYEDGSKVEELSERLEQLSAEELARAVIQGLRKESTSFQDHLSDSLYDLNPLPNLYFSRDAAMAYRDSYVIGGMAFDVRRNEAVIQECIWSQINGGDSIVYSGLRHRSAWPESDIRIEGGDFLVAEKNLLVIGISERTSAQSLDALVRSLMNRYDEPLDVIAVTLPKRRATIHLDMIFTYLDPEQVLVYEPMITGPNRLSCTHGRFEPGKSPVFTDYHGLPDALKALGRAVKPVFCGGNDPHTQQREQWFAGTNVFAFGPGKILTYDSNESTLESLSNAGFRVIPVSANEDWSKLASSTEQIAVSVPGIELARGGGGMRCMTMPLRRSPV